MAGSCLITIFKYGRPTSSDLAEAGGSVALRWGVESALRVGATVALSSLAGGGMLANVIAGAAVGVIEAARKGIELPTSR